MAMRFKPQLIAVLALVFASMSASSLVRAQPASDTLRSTEAQTAAPTGAPINEAEASAAPAAPAPPPAPKVVVPLKRPRYGVAIIQALDKVTAETERFEAPLNKPIRYKTLIFTVRACETTATDEDIIDAAAHVEVVSQPKAPEGGVAPPPRRVFKGWMFANSPGLDLLQHPIYDAWLIACKTELPSA